MSLFSILGTGRSGLQAAQQALDVTAQNVANSNTPGYSRQRVDQVSLQSTPNPGLYTGYKTTLSGTNVSGVERIKDEFLQANATNAAAKQSTLQSQVNPLNAVQTALNEPSDNGFQASLDQFYSDWSDLANDPATATTSAAGTQVLGDGSAIANQLNTLSHTVASEWTNQLSKLTSDVSEANAAANNVATLNAQITQARVGQISVNDLLDERDKAVTTLTTLVGATAASGVDGQVSISIGGVGIVSGNQVSAITVSGGGDISVQSTNPPTLTVGSLQVYPALGEAAGLLSSMNTDLPALSQQLDGVANALRDSVNSIQTTGYTIAGDQGSAFFTGTGAADIAVALTSQDQLAPSSIAGAVDGSNALKIANLADDNASAAALGGSPGPSKLYRELTSGLGTQVATLNTAMDSQTAIVTSTQNAVDSDSGVSLDEELTNMLLFQRAYQASAKVITTTDEMLQTLIGMVN